MRIINIKATNIVLTDAIKSRVESKAVDLEKGTTGFEPDAQLRVEIGKTSKHHAKGPVFFCEFQLHVPGQELRAVCEEEDLYDAIGQARDSVRRQLKQYKGKLQDRSKKAKRIDKSE